MLVTVPNFEIILMTWLIPLMRIGGLVMAMPIFGTKMMPTNVRVILALCLAVSVVPTLAYEPLPFSTASIIIAIRELLFGFFIGLLVHIFFQAFSVAGQIMAMQIGLGFAQMSDPSFGVSVPMLSQFYLVMVSLLFLVSGGHLAIFELLYASMHVYPPKAVMLPVSLDEAFAFGSFLFTGALKVALPMVATVLVVNFTFGIMSKAAPQLNIFSIGFPLTLIFGLAITTLFMYTILPSYQVLWLEFFEFIRPFGEIDG